jgi:hypothetical protein
MAPHFPHGLVCLCSIEAATLSGLFLCQFLELANLQGWQSPLGVLSCAPHLTQGLTYSEFWIFVCSDIDASYALMWATGTAIPSPIFLA